jgi:hypothetical protein
MMIHPFISFPLCMLFIGLWGAGGWLDKRRYRIGDPLQVGSFMLFILLLIVDNFPILMRI